MTLQQIREAKSLEDLKPAIAHLSDSMEEMGFGEFQAYRNVLSNKAKELGVSYTTLNDYAEYWQTFGRWEK